MCALSGELVIDLSAIRQNYKIINSNSDGNYETAVAVKANAYGTGIGKVAPTLYNAGAGSFFVATIDEGIELRKILTDVHIYILNGFSEGAYDAYIQYNLVPVLNSLHEIKLYQNYSVNLESELAAILHFDTGMNRLGIPADEAEVIFDDLSVLEGIYIQYVISHFSSSEESNNSVNDEQFQKFQKIIKYFPKAKYSICNSGGVFLSDDYHLDMVRTGIALYGGNPTDKFTENPMKAVVSLNVPVLQIKSVKKGETSGYNGSYRFHKNGRVSIMSIGYADGLLRSVGNGGALFWKGYKMPIRGRVSMDLVICDLSEIPEKNHLRIGDMVEVIGEYQSIDDLARSAGTISYEILTSLGSRYKRIYKD